MTGSITSGFDTFFPSPKDWLPFKDCFVIIRRTRFLTISVYAQLSCPFFVRRVPLGSFDSLRSSISLTYPLSQHHPRATSHTLSLTVEPVPSVHRSHNEPPRFRATARIRHSSTGIHRPPQPAPGLHLRPGARANGHCRRPPTSPSPRPRRAPHRRPHGRCLQLGRGNQLGALARGPRAPKEETEQQEPLQAQPHHRPAQSESGPAALRHAPGAVRGVAEALCQGQRGELQGDACAGGGLSVEAA
jgi:hypothetical protein